MSDRALVTGFVPYGGRGRNPAAEIATVVVFWTVAAVVVFGLLPPFARWRDKLGAQR